MRVFAEELRGRAAHVGEITAPAAGNADFLAGGFGVINHKHAGACVGGGHHASGTCADNERVDLHVRQVACKCRLVKQFCRRTG